MKKKSKQPAADQAAHPKTETARPTLKAALPTLEAGLPRTLGNWELLRLLGEGPLARVYQARALNGPSPEARYAVKVLRDEFADDPNMVNLLRREATVGRTVSHPHLIPVLSAQVHERPMFIVMPRLIGLTLAERIATRRPISVSQALWIARQTAQALDALHTAGWLHGDIKPSNVFLSPDGHVTLLDLGFAQPINDGGCPLTRPLLGTLHYMAPESLISTSRTDARSEVYSLGVMLFEMLAGRLPFPAKETSELIEQHLLRPASDLRVRNHNLRTAVASLVWKMLAKNTLRRPQSAKDLIRQLMPLEIDELPQRIPA